MVMKLSSTYRNKKRNISLNMKNRKNFLSICGIFVAKAYYKYHNTFYYQRKSVGLRRNWHSYVGGRYTSLSLNCIEPILFQQVILEHKENLLFAVFKFNGNFPSFSFVFFMCRFHMPIMLRLCSGSQSVYVNILLHTNKN